MRAIQTTDLLALRNAEKASMSATEWYDYIKGTDVTLDDLKQAKIDVLNADCEQAILAGFLSATTGHMYSFSQYDQMNLTQQMLVVVSDQALESIDWKTEDAGIVTHTRDEFLTVCHEAEEHKRTNISKYWTLKADVLAAKYRDTVDAITWQEGA